VCAWFQQKISSPAAGKRIRASQAEADNKVSTPTTKAAPVSRTAPDTKADTFKSRGSSLLLLRSICFEEFK